MAPKSKSKSTGKSEKIAVSKDTPSKRPATAAEETPGKKAKKEATKTSAPQIEATDPVRAVNETFAAKSLSDGIELGGINDAGVSGCPRAIMPVAGFGTYKLKKGECKEPVLEALRQGYRLVDTAQVYENEADVGAAIRESGIPRGNLCIETKVWRSSHGYDRTMKAFKQSAKKLGTDYVDVYLIHWPGAKTGWPLPRGTICPPDWTPALRDTGTWKAMEDLYFEGKVRAIGVCNYSIRHLKQLMKVCRVKPMVNQVEFHPKLVQTEMLDFCKKNGIVLQAYASLGSGDKQQAEEFFKMPPVQRAAKKHQVTPAQVLLRWAIDKGMQIVPKSCNPSRIAENSQLFSFALSKDEVADIDKMNENTRFAWKGLDPDTIE